MGGVLSVTDYETMLLPLTGFNSVHLSTHRKVKVKNADDRRRTAEHDFSLVPPYLHSWSSFIVDSVIQILSSPKTATNDIRI